LSGIGVIPNPEDNPYNHVVTKHEASTSINFEVLKAGNAGGNARIGVESTMPYVIVQHYPLNS
jgi:hypothetical protein